MGTCLFIQSDFAGDADFVANSVNSRLHPSGWPASPHLESRRSQSIQILCTRFVSSQFRKKIRSELCEVVFFFCGFWLIRENGLSLHLQDLIGLIREECDVAATGM